MQRNQVGQQAFFDGYRGPIAVGSGTLGLAGALGYVVYAASGPTGWAAFGLVAGAAAVGGVAGYGVGVGVEKIVEWLDELARRNEFAKLVAEGNACHIKVIEVQRKQLANIMAQHQASTHKNLGERERLQEKLGEVTGELEELTRALDASQLAIEGFQKNNADLEEVLQKTTGALADSRRAGQLLRQELHEATLMLEKLPEWRALSAAQQGTIDNLNENNARLATELETLSQENGRLHGFLEELYRLIKNTITAYSELSPGERARGGAAILVDFVRGASVIFALALGESMVGDISTALEMVGASAQLTNNLTANLQSAVAVSDELRSELEEFNNAINVNQEGAQRNNDRASVRAAVEQGAGFVGGHRRGAGQNADGPSRNSAERGCRVS